VAPSSAVEWAWSLIGGASAPTVASRARGVLIAGLFATLAALAAVYRAFSNPLANVSPLPGAVAFGSVFIVPFHGAFLLVSAVAEL